MRVCCRLARFANIYYECENVVFCFARYPSSPPLSLRLSLHHLHLPCDCNEIDTSHALIREYIFRAINLIGSNEIYWLQGVSNCLFNSAVQQRRVCLLGIVATRSTLLLFYEIYIYDVMSYDVSRVDVAAVNLAPTQRTHD